VCDAEYTHKLLFECVSARKQSKYIKHRKQEFVMIIWVHPTTLLFRKICRKNWKAGNSYESDGNFEKTESLENCRHDSIVFSRDVKRIASTNSRRHRKLIKPIVFLKKSMHFYFFVMTQLIPCEIIIGSMLTQGFLKPCSRLGVRVHFVD